MTSGEPIAPDDRERVEAALGQGGLIDMTTRGRRSGRPRRIEVGFFPLDGRVYISGMPGRRGWYANILADPRFTFHLKRGVRADLPARATPITDVAERRRILAHITKRWGQEGNLERFVAHSPLIEVTFDSLDESSTPS
jgi:deazaflavin-dependent oxidoreductase (nitroreductase family)